ncbi:MAG: superoxide dismutase family protein [Steroidobacteraceae bacterium]
MKAHALTVLLPFALLAACNRAEPPAAATPPVTTSAAEPAPPATATAEVTEGAAPVAVETPGTTMAQAVLASASGSKVAGQLNLTVGASGVVVAGELSGLTPNTVHGFHVHENGDCSAPDASSAGAHFNPGHAAHGGPETAAKHLGDIPNVQSDAKGNAVVNATISGATLRDGGANDVFGKAVVVHAKRDDYKTQPSGDSGDRIACGVVR